MGVETREKQSYQSAWARAPNQFLTMADQHKGELVIEESSSLGTVIGVLFLIALLVTALAYFVLKNRRLRRTFQELQFSASHYSSATGAAVLIDEDDESPIIRGFSDNE